MNKRITIKDIDEMIEETDDLNREEDLARHVGNYELGNLESLIRELDDLKFHIARFADEGATLKEIKAYEDIVNYAEHALREKEYLECAKTLTSLKLLFGLDVTFFSLLPKLKEDIKEHGPISFESLTLKARKKDIPRDINRKNEKGFGR